MTDHGIPDAAGTRLPAGLVLGAAALWLAAVFAMSLGGALEAPQGAPPLRVLTAAGVPVLVFVLWYRISPAFRAWVLGLDLRLVVMLQAWRVIGGVFLVLLAFGILPGLFAWPAGLGDVAVGLTAPAAGSWHGTSSASSISSSP